MLRQIFLLRRKTIRNNLTKFVSAEQCDKALEIAGISPSERAENLSVEKLLQLSDAINSVIIK